MLDPGSQERKCPENSPGAYHSLTEAYDSDPYLHRCCVIAAKSHFTDHIIYLLTIMQSKTSYYPLLVFNSGLDDGA